MVKAGFSEVEITPYMGMTIPGYFRERIATGVKEPLFAKAFVVQGGEALLAIVALDAIVIDYSDAAEIKVKASRLTGIPEENMMVSATHTHTGGPVADLIENVKDEKYVDFLVERAADAIVLAKSRLEQVRIGFGVGCEKDIANIRRFFMKDGTYKTNPKRGDPNIDRADGVIDPDVAVIRIDDMDGSPKAVITNYACHLDCVGGTEFSPDYAGELSRTVKKTLGKEVVSIFLTGACGNINHHDFSRDVVRPADYYKRMGRILAYEALRVREKIELFEEAVLEVRGTCFDAGVRVPSREDISHAEKIIEEKEKQEVLDYHYANEVLKLAKMNITSVKFPVQVFKIGELAITALPGEIFDEFALEIKAKSPFKYNIINTLANANVGYVPIREAYARGGYEPRLNAYSKVKAGVGEEMLSTALKLINSLKN